MADYPEGTVVIDNGPGHAVRVGIGRHAVTLEAGEYREVRVPGGTHWVTTWDESGKQLDLRPFEVEDSKRYVLNVLGRNTYHRGAVRYGPGGDRAGSEEEVQDRWLEANVDHLFESPPASAAPGSARTYLTRQPRE